MAKKDEIYIATESGSCEVDGESLNFTKGITRVANVGQGAKLLRAVPDYFKLVEDQIHYGVEQATAAPGEKRGTAK
jgi:hypothetical protein